MSGYQQMLNSVSSTSELLELFRYGCEMLDEATCDISEKRKLWMELAQYTNEMKKKLDFQETVLFELNKICETAADWWLSNFLSGKLTNDQRESFGNELVKHLTVALSKKQVVCLETDADCYPTGLFRNIMNAAGIDVKMFPNVSMSVTTQYVWASAANCHQDVCFIKSSSDPGMKCI